MKSKCNFFSFVSKIVFFLFISFLFSIILEFVVFQKNFYFFKNNGVFYNDYSIALTNPDSNNLLSDGNIDSSLNAPFLILKNDSYSFIRGVYFDFSNFESRHLPIRIYYSDSNGFFSEEYVQGRLSLRKKKGYVPVGQYSKNLKIVIGRNNDQFTLNSLIINPKLKTVINNLDQTRILRLSILLFFLCICYYFRNRLKLYFISSLGYFQKIDSFQIIGFNPVSIITQLLLLFFFIHSFTKYYSLITLYFPDNFFYYFYRLLCCIALYKLILMLLDKKIIFASLSFISLVLLYAVFYISKSESFIYEFVLLSVCCYNLSYKRIFLVYFLGIGLIISSEIILMLTGVLKDIAYFREIGEYRHSFGAVYPTDFACSILFVCLALWSILKKTYCIIGVVVLATLIFFQLLYTHTRNTELVMGISIVLIVLYSLVYKRSDAICRLKVVSFSLKYSFFLLSLLSIGLGYFYDSSNLFLEYLNDLLSGRLSLVHSALQNYGITLMGQHIVLVGNGGSLVVNEGYNFIDSSYCLLLIRYGLIAFVIFTVMYIYTQKRFLANENLKLSFVLLLIAIHSFTEHHYIEFFYNPCLLLLFADVKNLIPTNQEVSGNC